MAITLDQLEILRAIEAQGTFAGAARTLHRVPSAVSYGVRSLEDALGLPLFDRSGHRAVLTPAGRRILEEAQAVLSRVEALERVAVSLSDGWEPELSIVVDGSLPMAPITEAVMHLTAADPPTRVQLHVEYQSGVQARFEQSQAALMLPVEIEVDDTMQARPLRPLPMLVVAAPGHPLSAAESLERGDLRGHIELVVKDSSPQFQSAPRASWFASEHVVHLSDFHSKRLALLAGGGFGWMPDHLVRDDLSAGRLVPLGLGERGRWTYTPQLITAAGSPPRPAAQFFIDALGDLFASVDQGGQ